MEATVSAAGWDRYVASILLPWRRTSLHMRILLLDLAAAAVLLPVLGAALGAVALAWLLPLGMAIIGAMVALTYIMVVRPLRRVEGALTRLAAGDLSHAAGDLRTRDAGEVGRMVGAVADLRDQLRQEVYQGLHQSESLVEHSGQLDGTAEEMGQAVQFQARQTADVSHSAQEVNQVVQDVASKVTEVSQSASNASNTAEEGMETLAGASQRVKAMLATSGEVAKIAGTIQEIAKKTDLLALNAAIEAANAGEQGKGFAVVADEVRKLAENTREATTSIDSILDRLQGEVGDSAESMDRVMEGMTGILGMIEHTDSLAGQIAASAEELAATMSEVTGQISDVAESSQTLSQSVEQIQEASRAISEMAEKIRSEKENYAVH
ncbi:methyl-accepting chemotaxis protein [Thiohalorhabdus sp. Cl-TMA]|uniref:Methyl-accepting chemotaxis protein n=1 Tax=Thiohalorhabdus methylotrophus TaxID=3242694 RepID=A0ABV4TW40_9GAMM